MLDGKLMPSLTYQDGALVYRQNALGLDQGCCCNQCAPCENGFAEEITATLTVYDGTMPFGGGCGGVSGVYAMVLTRIGDGQWYGFVDLDNDGLPTANLDYEVYVTIENCTLVILTNILSGNSTPATWPPGVENASWGFGECGVPPSGNLDPAASPYCQPPAGIYDSYLYGLFADPPCDVKYCAFTLEIDP